MAAPTAIYEQLTILLTLAAVSLAEGSRRGIGKSRPFSESAL